MALGAQKLICIIDGPILDESGRLIRFLTLQDADMLVRKRAEQSETAANYVKAVSQEDFNCLGHNGSNGSISYNMNGFSQQYSVTFQNGVGFDNGNGLWSSEQGFAIGGQERLSRLNGYLSELAAAAFVCRVRSWLSNHYICRFIKLSNLDNNCLVIYPNPNYTTENCIFSKLDP